MSDANIPTPAPATIEQRIFTTQFESKWNFQLRPNTQVNQFQIEGILVGLISAMQDVDPIAWLKSWNTPNADKVYLRESLPTSDEGISLYVENPDTTPVGTHGQLCCQFTFVTRIKLEKIKQDRGFSAWMYEQGLFLDLRGLRTTRPKQIGISNKTLPHVTPIHLFNTILRQAVTISHP